MTHERYEENAGAYLLGALPELERQAYERHLEGCDDCRRDVERLRAGAEALPRAVPSLSPPPELKQSLMETVEREAAQHAPVRPTRAKPGRRFSDLLPRLPRFGPALALGSVIVLLAGVAIGVGLSSESAEGTRTVAAQVDRQRLPRASARLVVADDRRTAVLRTSGMPSLGADSIYQVWLEHDGEVLSQSLFEVGGDGRGAGAVLDRLDDADAVMVTREPAGGSRAPTEAPLVTVRL